MKSSEFVKRSEEYIFPAIKRAQVTFEMFSMAVNGKIDPTADCETVHEEVHIRRVDLRYKPIQKRFFNLLQGSLTTHLPIDIVDMAFPGELQDESYSHFHSRVSLMHEIQMKITKERCDAKLIADFFYCLDRRWFTGGFQIEYKEIL